MKIKKDNLSLWKIALGAIFLFNPTINIVDPLPDFLGYLFIISGISALAYLNDDCLAAKKSFVYLTVLSVAKLLMCFLLPFIMDDTMGTLFAFSFAVAEGVFFIGGVYRLFEGIASLGMRYGNENVFYMPLKKRKAKKIAAISQRLSSMNDAEKSMAQKKISRLEKRKSATSLRNFTVAAFLVRAAGGVIPTLPSLSMTNITEFYADGINWRNYTAPLYIFVWIVGFAVCIPWLIKFSGYIKSIARENELCEKIYERYSTEVLSDPLRLTADRMKNTFILILVGLALLVYMPVDGINIFPGFISASLFFAAFAFMYRENAVLSVAGAASSFGYGVLSVIGTYLQADYAKDYVRSENDSLYKAVTHGVIRAVEKFENMQIYAWIEGGLLLVTGVLLAVLVFASINRHIDMIPKRADGKSPDKKKLLACLIPVLVLGIIVLLANCVLLTAMKYLTEAWIINAILVIALFCVSLRAYYSLSDSVYERLRRKY